ncbi:hypothetical protein FPQ18DRAFT_409396, partial [Pyronema domesticum]
TLHTFLVTCVLFLAPGVHALKAGTEDFSNNFISDLGPLLSLFGERVTMQFLSHSTSWLDNLIFACGPIGIITAASSAIRVAGSRGLKNIIGRAREAEAQAELEFMSSISPDVCEQWNGVGIVRLVGTPSIIELIYNMPPKTLNNLSPTSLANNVHTLKTAKKRQLPRLISRHPAGWPEAKNVEDDPENHIELDYSIPPKIFLNVSSRSVSDLELKIVATVGVILQLAILVYDGVITYHGIFSDTPQIAPYAFPLTIIGTIGVNIGMYICSYVIEASTAEEIWGLKEGDEKSQFWILWLQKGEFVGDQIFKLYVLHNPIGQNTIRTSRKLKVNRNLQLWKFLGFSTSVISFILQFIGLRAVHWTASIAQLIVTMVMTILRVSVRRNISMGQKQSLSPTDISWKLRLWKLRIVLLGKSLQSGHRKATILMGMYLAYARFMF